MVERCLEADVLLFSFLFLSDLRSSNFGATRSDQRSLNDARQFKNKCSHCIVVTRFLLSPKNHMATTANALAKHVFKTIHENNLYPREYESVVPEISKHSGEGLDRLP